MPGGNRAEGSPIITKKQFDAIYAQTCAVCGGAHPTSEGTSIDLDLLFERALNAVYNKNEKKAKRQLSNSYAAHLSKAVSDGYGKRLFDLAWNSPDAEQIRHLQKNIYEFSFAKTHEQLKALTMALYDKEGRIVPFSEFKEIATRINNEVGVKHLKTEYDTAVASAQMASRWVQYQQESDQFPNLTYQTVGDGRVRQSHAALDNVTRPITDEFWKTYYPPNGWNCRCDVIQSVGGALTPPDKITTPNDVPDLFKTNLAENGMAFPPGHPVFSHLPKDVMTAAHGSNPFAYEKVHEGKNGGYVYENATRRLNKDELRIAKILANEGNKIISLPEIAGDTDAQQTLRNLVMPSGCKPRKSPDVIDVNGSLFDFKKTAATKSAIDNAIRDAAAKADKITPVIWIDAKMTKKQFIEYAGGRVRRSESIEAVWVVDHKGKVKKYNRSVFEQKKK